MATAIGAEPIITTTSSSTPESFADFVEYCHGNASTPMGSKRIAALHELAQGLHRLPKGDELPRRLSRTHRLPARLVRREREQRNVLTVPAGHIPKHDGIDWLQAMPSRLLLPGALQLSRELRNRCKHSPLGNCDGKRHR